MSEKPTVLVIDDKPNMLKMLSNLLAKNYEVRTCSNGREGLEEFRRASAELVISDIRMPGMDGMELLKRIKEEDAETEVILMTAFGEIAQAVEAVKAGAYHYVTKPFEPEELLLTVEKALERKKLKERTRILQQEVEEKFGFSNIIGSSEAMQHVYELARKAAASETTVLLTGESGTGKELFARAIHYSSPRAQNRFVAINCGAMPKELIESELFGHVKGAFSGATKDKKGLFEEAHRGTLFLDEITELAPDLQIKINRAIQEREIRRVGDTKDLPVDVRIIASTNRDIKEALEQGGLREDLYYRLNVFPIHLPPLRERQGDIPLLINHFMGEFAADGSEQLALTPEAMQVMLGHGWPGNVRELRNALERAVVLVEGGRIGPAHLSFHGEAAADEESADFSAAADLPYRDAMNRMSVASQRRYLLEVLRRFDGNVTRAAEHAGIERESFHRLMRKCDIKSDDVKQNHAGEM